MLYRKFGPYDLSVLAFGTATFAAGKMRPEADTVQGIRTLRIALDAGINLIHSGSDLGTQPVVRTALFDHPLRHSVHHLVKIKPSRQDSYRDALQSYEGQIDTALTNLGIDRISIAEIVFPKETATKPVSSIIDDVCEVLAGPREKGKIEIAVLLAESEQQSVSAIDSGTFEGLMAYFNLIDCRFASFFDSIEAQKMGFIGISPLKRGKLTGFTNPEMLGLSDRHLGTEIGELFNRQGISFQALAVKFALSHRTVRAVVTSASTPEQLIELAEAANEPLANRLFEALLNAIGEQKAQ